MHMHSHLFVFGQVKEDLGCFWFSFSCSNIDGVLTLLVLTPHFLITLGIRIFTLSIYEVVSDVLNICEGKQYGVVWGFIVL